MNRKRNRSVEYATGAKDVEDEHYGWACAITSQEISYAYGPGPGKDMPPSVEELPAREEEDLLLTMIVIYQKYTCMIFNEKIHQRFTSGDGLLFVLLNIKFFPILRDVRLL